MRLMMIFVDNFEDTEAFATRDVLLRGKDEVINVSLMGREIVTSKCGISFKCDALIENINYQEFDGLIIPGGPGSFKIMPNIPVVNELIHYFAKSNKLVASICAAPHLVGKLGYFKDIDFVVHPGFEDVIIGGNNKMNIQGVCRAKNFITAKSMWYSIDFGLAIHEYYHGKESRELLAKQCRAELN